MPRQGRKKSSTGIYHIMLRGVNHNVIFYDEEDRYYFLRSMEIASKRSECAVYCYCLMDNHVHILVKDCKDNLDNFVKRLGSGYVLWYNNKYARCGHLFQDRFRSETVETDEYLLVVMRYILRNPVIAGIVNDMKDYKWSSYQAFIDNQIQDKWLDTHFIMNYFGQDRDKCIENFKDYINIDTNDICLDLDNKKKRTDTELVKYIQDEMKINSIADIARMESGLRDETVSQIKNYTGASIRQLSRVLGIGKRLIEMSDKKG